jgi:hypothetical protein
MGTVATSVVREPGQPFAVERENAVKWRLNWGARCADAGSLMELGTLLCDT